MSIPEKYLVLYPDGSSRYITTDRSQLNVTIREAIGCDIFECVRTPYGVMMLVDECGVISGLQLMNPYASAFYTGSDFGSYIFGPVVFCCEGFVDCEPDVVPVPPRLLNHIECLIDRMRYLNVVR